MDIHSGQSVKWILRRRHNSLTQLSVLLSLSCSYVAADALLVESEGLYHGNGTLGTKVVVGAMDARVVLKDA